MTETAETRLAALNLSLPEPRKPVANYVPALIAGNLLYISGQISISDQSAFKGKLGDGVTVETGKQAAQTCCLNVLAHAKTALGSLERIAQAVRVTGYVNAVPDFQEHPAVINGASDLLVAVLGEKGQHTRAAIGVGSLPLGVSVEIDAIFAIS